MTSLKVKHSAVHLQRREESSRDLAAVFHYPRSPCEAEECTEMDGSVRLLFWSPSWCHLPWPCSPFRILHANTHTICSLSIYPPPLDLNKRGIYQTFIMISVNDKAALNGHIDLKSRCGTLHKGLTYFPHSGNGVETFWPPCNLKQYVCENSINCSVITLMALSDTVSAGSVWKRHGIGCLYACVSVCWVSSKREGNL